MSASPYNIKKIRLEVEKTTPYGDNSPFSPARDLLELAPGSPSLIPAHATAVLEINLGSIVQNYRFLSEKLQSPSSSENPQTEKAAFPPLSKTLCSAVVKADAYGLGMEPIAMSLARAGCNDFFVAYIDEGIKLRDTLPDVNIYVLMGILPGTEHLMYHYGLTPVLNDRGQLEIWRKLSHHYDFPLPAILHFDTGMARNGFDKHDLKDLQKNPEWLTEITPRYYMSHLACSENFTHPMNGEQNRRLQDILRTLPPVPVSFANSGGIFLGKDYHYDLARPGKVLYGMHPIPEQDSTLHPVVSLRARVIQTHSLKKGETVGYYGTHTLPRDSRIATLSLGYADGYHRSLSNEGHVYFGDFAAKVVGRISMDYVTVDITDIPEAFAHTGSWAEIIGPHISVPTIAAQAGTIGREILVHLGTRYHRCYTTTLE